MSVRAWVRRVAWQNQGTELTADVAAGETLLPVEWAEPFDDAGGTVELNGVRLEYVDVDVENDTITLADPLETAAEIDDPVYVVTGGQVTTDYIAYATQGEGDDSEILIPFAERDTWPEGDYPDPVPVLLDDELTKIIDVPGRTPTRDGTFLDPDTLPVPDLTDGLPPTASPTPVVSGGIRIAVVSWGAVTNADPVTYDVHARTTAGVPTDGSVLIGSTDATVFVFDAAPGPVFVKVVARDDDGAAASGAEASGTVVDLPAEVDLGPLQAELDATEASVAVLDGRLDTAEGSLSTLNTTTLPGLQTDLDAAETAVGDLTARFPVIAADIAAGAVTATKLGDGSVLAAKLADAAVTVSKIDNDAVTAAKLAAGAVTTTKITDDAITSAKIVAGAVQAAEIAAGAVVAGKIAADAVTAGTVAAGAITTAKLAAGAVTANEIDALAVTAAKIAAGAVTAGKVAADAITATEIAAGSVTADEIAALAITAGKIAAGAVVADKIAAGAVVAGKIAADAVTANEIAAGAITASEIGANAVTAVKIDAGAVVAGKIGADVITAVEIAAGAITADEIGAGAIVAGKLAAGAVTTASMTANTINGDRILVNTLNADRIVTNTITADKIIGGDFTGKTFTGAVLQTAATGERIVVRNDGSGGIIESFSGFASETPGAVDPGSQGGRPAIGVRSGTTPMFPEVGSLYLISGPAGSSEASLSGSQVTIAGNTSISISSPATTIGRAKLGAFSPAIYQFMFEGGAQANTNGSGIATFSHGVPFAVAPTAVLIEQKNLLNTYQYEVASKTTTGFTVQLRNRATGASVSTSGVTVTIDFIAILL